jgi:hypothetical protein
MGEIPETWREQQAAEPSEKDRVYDRIGLQSPLHSLDRNMDGGVDRQEWRRAQSHDWHRIWLWPAAMAAATCLLFLAGFHDRVDRQTLESMAEESVLGAGEGSEPQVG